MKKITLISITLFILIVSTIYIFGTADNSDVITRKVNQSGAGDKSVSYENKIKKHKKLNIKHIASPNIDILTIKKQLESAQSASAGIGISEVFKHNTLNDCYLVINGNVYDVTSYIPYHPAGSRIIARYCGNEVTGIFAQIHSNRAWDLLKNYKIGTISAGKIDVMPKLLEILSTSIAEKNPNAIVLKISPKPNAYIAKVIYDGRFYELHINNNGKIFKEEIGNDEIHWDTWDSDADDTAR